MCTRTHTHAPQAFRQSPRVLVPALKQFIEASLHGHSFWNSNCYLIQLKVVSPLHLRVTLKHLLSTCNAQHRHTTQIGLFLYEWLLSSRRWMMTPPRLSFLVSVKIIASSPSLICSDMLRNVAFKYYFPNLTLFILPY